MGRSSPWYFRTAMAQIFRTNLKVSQQVTRIANDVRLRANTACHARGRKAESLASFDSELVKLGSLTTQLADVHMGGACHVKMDHGKR